MAGSTQPIKKDRILADLIRERILPDLIEKSGMKSQQDIHAIDELQNYRFEESDIIAFSEFLMMNDVASSLKIVESHISHGCSAPILVISLLCDSARYLGDLWCKDNVSFAEVTIGMAALHQVLRHLDKHLARELVVSSEEGRSILLTTMPGDTHIFGISVLESFFRNSGWIVEIEFDVSRSDLINRVSENLFDIVGFSVACSESVDTCKALAAVVRKYSINKNIKIMAGGSSFLRNNRLLSAVGIDATAGGALEALNVASTLCAPKHLDKLKADNV
ncbi:MAG: cobalamin B12-binding domain-containing protein [Pseudomonadota bacterium]